MRHSAPALYSFVVGLFLLLMPGLHANSQHETHSFLQSELFPQRIEQLPDSAQPRISMAIQPNTANSGSRLLKQYWGAPDGSGSTTIQPHVSDTYTYSGGRGGDLTASNPQKYDSMFIWAADTVASSWTEVTRVFQTFDASSHLLSRTQLELYIGAWTNWIYEEWQYNAAGLDTLHSSYDWNIVANTWQLKEQIHTSYNAARLPVAIWDYTGYMWSATVDSFTYDAANRIVGHYSGPGANGNWAILIGMVYDYTPSGLVSQITRWVGQGNTPDTIARYHYNIDNQLEAKYAYNNSHSNPPVIDSYYISDHTTSGLPTTTTNYRYDNIGSWLPEIRYTATYTGSNLPSTEIAEIMNGQGYWYKLLFRYNSVGQLTYEDQESMVNGVWGHYLDYDWSLRYYYDINNTAVASVAKSSLLQMQVRPIPANDQITVYVQLKQSQSLIGGITNLAGQQVMKWKEEGQSSYTRKLAMAHLPVGIYSIFIRCSDGSYDSKVFSVQH